ncbi:YciI family protein [Mucilaginibacter sp. KACC 22063]|uniref:YciI family protein n=1 Tax=Mucilaginibacter sp. KACC 22063 TaxID=3025666 RepID=UPI002366DF0C|nr:YciI family protein [Mucilaginibacter sp. KACC 22063]WDF53726.1 YciI family protein [Mucilaginibacter sp. KACC 22063]
MMNQYLITAYDHIDTEALTRRLNVRPHHLDAAKKLKESGNFIKAGAMLNQDGNMIGSVMMMQFESEEALNAWLQDEPYITQKVWETVDVKPIRVADL